MGQSGFSVLLDVNNSSDAGSDVFELYDGYLITGVSVLPGVSEKLLILKTDLAGNIKFKKVYPLGDSLSIRYGETISIGNNQYLDYRTVFKNDTGTGQRKDWTVLTKFNNNGDTIWTKHFKFSNKVHGYSLMQYSDTVAFLVSSEIISDTDSDPLLIAIDSSGNELFRQSINTPKKEVLYSICKCDGAIYLGGNGNSQAVSGFDPFIVKIDDTLNHIWSKYYRSNSGYAAFVSCIGKKDISFGTDTFIERRGSNNFTKKQIFRIAGNGDVLWNSVFDSLGRGNSCGKVVEVENGSVVLGRTGISNSNYQVISTLTKFDDQGDTIWAHNYWFDSYDYQNYTHDIIRTNDGGFVIVGDINLINSRPTQDIWLLKVDSSGCYDSDCSSRSYDKTLGIENSQASFGHFEVYPNPTGDVIRIQKIGSKTNDYLILDLNGRMVKKGGLSSSQAINVEGLKAGRYTLMIRNDKNISIGTFMKN